MPDPRQAARDWILLALPEVSIVIDMDQQTSDAPRPDVFPYAGITLQSSRPMGWATPVESTDDTGTSSPPAKFPQRQGWTREGQLLIMLYGAGAVDLADTLQLSLSRHDVIELLDGLGVSIQRPQLTDNAAAILDTSREPRASLILTVAWYQEISADVDVIESVDYDTTVQEG